MPQQPAMLEGMRQPRSVRIEDMRKQSDPSLPVAHAPEGITVYVSPYRKYRVQVTAPSAYIDPASGRKNTGGKMHVAEFDEGIFRNNDRDPAVRKLYDEALQSNKYFGRFGGGPGIHFWLASDQNEQMETAKVKGAINVLKSLPREQVEAFVAELKQGDAADHELPPANTPDAKRTTKPIAA